MSMVAHKQSWDLARVYSVKFSVNLTLGVVAQTQPWVDFRIKR